MSTALPGRSTVNALVMLLVVLAIGVVGYVAIEGWTVIEAVWMVFITLTTIGYGEIHPLSPAGRVFTILLIGGGLGVVTYALTQVSGAVIEGQFARAVRERRRERMLEALNKHFIVVGYGRLGRVVAKELHQGGHPVCVIERDDAGVSADTEPYPVILGDGADDAVLRRAGIERARGVSVTAAPEAEAIYITLSARQLNPLVPILTRVDSDVSAVKARRAGANQVVSPHAMGGWRMALGLMRPHTTSLLDLATFAEHEEVMLDEIEVASDCPWCGRTLKDLQVGERQGVLVVGVRHPDGRLLATPKGSTVIDSGDILIVIGGLADVRRFARTLTGRGGEG